MTRWIPIALLLVSMTALLYAADASQTASRARAHKRAPSDDGYAREVAPLIKTLCARCPTGKNAPTGLALDKYPTRESVLKARSAWEQVSQNIIGQTMPPKGAPQPSQQQRDLICGWIDSTFTKLDCNLHDPGRVTLRRLNRA